MPSYRTAIVAPAYFDYDGDAVFLLDRIRELATPIIVARFDDVTRTEAEERRADINQELRSRGLPELPSLTLVKGGRHA